MDGVATKNTPTAADQLIIGPSSSSHHSSAKKQIIPRVISAKELALSLNKSISLDPNIEFYPINSVSFGINRLVMNNRMDIRSKYQENHLGMGK